MQPVHGGPAAIRSRGETGEPSAVPFSGEPLPTGEPRQPTPAPAPTPASFPPSIPRRQSLRSAAPKPDAHRASKRRRRLHAADSTPATSPPHLRRPPRVRHAAVPPRPSRHAQDHRRAAKSIRHVPVPLRHRSRAGVSSGERLAAESHGGLLLSFSGVLPCPARRRHTQGPNGTLTVPCLPSGTPLLPPPLRRPSLSGASSGERLAAELVWATTSGAFLPCPATCKPTKR